MVRPWPGHVLSSAYSGCAWVRMCYAGHVLFCSRAGLGMGRSWHGLGWSWATCGMSWTWHVLGWT
jgi:hypothetical protein